MAGDAIKLDKTQSAAILAQQVLNTVSAARNALSQVQATHDVLQQCFTSGGSIDWTRLESLCGLTAGDGVNLYTFFDGAVGAAKGTMTNSNWLDLVNRVIG